MLVVTWLEGLTWLISVAALVGVPADDVAASSASAGAFESPLIVGSRPGLPTSSVSFSSVFTLFNLLPSLFVADVLCGSPAVLSAPARQIRKVWKISY